MGLIPQKHKFDNIGKATATLTFLVLSKGSTAFLSKGLLGKVVYFGLTKFYSFWASKGLVFLNVGISAVETMAEKKDFDASWDEAFKAINAKNGNLTDAEIKAIDAKVIADFERFIDMSRSK